MSQFVVSQGSIVSDCSELDENSNVVNLGLVSPGTVIDLSSYPSGAIVRWEESPEAEVDSD